MAAKNLLYLVARVDEKTEPLIQNARKDGRRFYQACLLRAGTELRWSDRIHSLWLVPARGRRKIARLWSARPLSEINRVLNSVGAQRLPTFWEQIGLKEG